MLKSTQLVPARHVSKHTPLTPQVLVHLISVAILVLLVLSVQMATTSLVVPVYLVPSLLLALAAVLKTSPFAQVAMTAIT